MKNNLLNFSIGDYIAGFHEAFPDLAEIPPWHIVRDICGYIENRINLLGSDPSYVIQNQVAIHKLARIEENVILKPPVIITANCFIASNAYLRAGIWLGENVTVGPGTELKSTIVMDHSALAHFNFAGDSIIGSYVNMEAGSVIANHHNDREDKTIRIKTNKGILTTDVTKFGSILGDHSKIGANAVLCPGTIFEPGSIVKRLALIE